MVLVVVGHMGRRVRPGPFRDPHRGAGGAPASGFGAWALVWGGMQSSRLGTSRSAGRPPPRHIAAYRGGLLPAGGPLARTGLAWRSSLASWRRLTEVKPGVEI